MVREENKRLVIKWLGMNKARFAIGSYEWENKAIQ